jgi:hypothetical protein
VGKQDKTAEKLTRKPTPSDVKWRELESFLLHKGFTKKESKRGSGVKFFLKLPDGNVRMIALHKNHPSPNVCEGAVEDVVKVLKELKML